MKGSLFPFYCCAQWIGIGMILLPENIARRLHVENTESFGDAAHGSS